MKKKLLKENLPFCVLLILYSGALFYLFFQQCIRVDTGIYFSDMKAYLLEISGQSSGYSFPYPVFFDLSKLLSFILPIPIAVSVILSILNGLSVVVTYKYFVNHLCDRHMCCIFSTLATFTVFLVSMLYFSFDGSVAEGWGSRYLGVFSPNPFHNATYLATRPFSILLLLQFIQVLKTYESCKGKDISLLALYLLLSALTKPSFVFVFAPIMAITMIIKWFGKKFHLKKVDFAIVISAFPTIFVLIYQFVLVFRQGTGGALRIGPGKCWHLWTSGIKISVVLAALFPLFFLIFHLKQLKTNLLYRFSWASYFVGISTFFLFYEDGFRIWDANFAWGYMHGLFFVFFSSVLMLVQEFTKQRLKAKWYNWIAAALLFYHLVCGIFFLLYMLNGGSASLF